MSELKDTKLLKLLATLSEKELKQLESYLIFKQASKEIIKLFKCIESAYQKSKGKWEKIGLTIDAVNLRVLGKKKDDSTARNLRSNLLKYVKDYCRFNQFEQEEQDLYFLKYCVERDSHYFFEPEYEHLQTQIFSQIGVASNKKHFEAYELYRQLLAKQQVKKEAPDYQENFDRFLDFSLLKQIYLYCCMLNRKMTDTFEFKEGFEEEMKVVLQKAKERANILVVVDCYETYILLAKGAKEQSIILEEKMKTREKYLHREDLESLRILMQNYQIHHTQKSKEDLYKNYFAQFDNKNLHDGRFVPPRHAKNLCSIIPAMTQYTNNRAEAEEKIQEVVNEVRPKYKEIILQYGLGVLYFYCQEYPEAIKKFRQIQQKITPDPFFDFDGRTILLRSYYLVDEQLMWEKDKDFDKMEAIDNQVQNFRRSLNKSSLDEDHKEGYLNFITALERLYELKSQTWGKKEKEKAIHKLKDFLATPNVKAKDWLLSQID